MVGGTKNGSVDTQLHTTYKIARMAAAPPPAIQQPRVPAADRDYLEEPIVTTDDYRRALATAIREYEALGQQRQDIDKRLAEVMQTIGTLSRLCGLVPTVPIGLTDACRLVVRGAGVPVTPAEVRQRLQAIGFDLSKYANDLAAIHTILKRLSESGELRFVPRAFVPMGGTESAKPAYIWNQGRHVVALGADIKAFMRDADLEREAMRAHDEPNPPPGRTRSPRPHKKGRSA